MKYILFLRIERYLLNHLFNCKTMKNRNSARVFIGLLFILIGGILFLRITNITLPFDMPDYLFRWPMILIILGLFFFFTRENRTTGLILFAVGAVFLATYVFDVTFGTVIQYAIPIILVIAGLLLLLPGGYLKKKRDYRAETKDNYLNAVHIFSGGSNVIEAEQFNGGEVTCIFGGSEVFFRNTELGPGSNVLTVSCIFGGCDIHVPADWTVKTETAIIFSGVEDKRHKSDPYLKTDPEKVLYIKGSLLFSGLDIKKV